ncbi:isocitrate lyase/PEP mutase family protein [Desertivirga brevis]|uniref:isocitrate lyase/PEP mutase family protein n=1 Tax=Desertivirga brevis TaxID=2810310 RepID=UPI001A96F8B6
MDIPVSADIVGGFADSHLELEYNISKLIEAGIVGVNIEDSINEGTLKQISEQVKNLEVIRSVAQRYQVHLVINARIDTYWQNGDSSDIEETIERAYAYKKAGADCIFVPGITNLEEVRELRKKVNCPINLLANNLPIEKLQELKIERLSLGGLPFRATLGYLSASINELQMKTNLNSFNKYAMNYNKLMEWFM